MKQVDAIKEVDLPELVRMLESHDEDVIYLAKDGAPVAQLTLINSNRPVKRRLGVAKGELVLPDGFDEMFDKMDKEIEEMFDKDIFEQQQGQGSL